MQLIFGIGALWGTRSDVTGVGPDQFAILQDNSIDFSFELKELYSQVSFPVDIARGKGKITGKAKMARVFGNLYADLFFGTTANTGETNVSENEQNTVPNTPPYQITPANATSSTFVADLGVYYLAGAKTGTRFTSTTGTAPASAGTYYCNAATGVYTFNSVDAAAVVGISYVYTDAAGKSITLTNNFMGYTPTFTGTFYQQRNTQGSTGQLTLRLNECVSSHLTFPSRIDDYGIPDFDYQAFSNQAGNIGVLSTSE
jgi:hypothetical protein